MIKSYNFIRCDDCGTTIEIGQDAYELDGKYHCEACFDKRLERVKNDSKVEVNHDNFDLEEQVMNLGYSSEFS